MTLASSFSCSSSDSMAYRLPPLLEISRLSLPVTKEITLSVHCFVHSNSCMTKKPRISSAAYTKIIANRMATTLNCIIYISCRNNFSLTDGHKNWPTYCYTSKQEHVNPVSNIATSAICNPTSPGGNSNGTSRPIALTTNIPGNKRTRLNTPINPTNKNDSITSFRSSSGIGEFLFYDCIANFIKSVA